MSSHPFKVGMLIEYNGEQHKFVENAKGKIVALEPLKSHDGCNLGIVFEVEAFKSGQPTGHNLNTGILPFDSRLGWWISSDNPLIKIISNYTFTKEQTININKRIESLKSIVK